MGSGLAFCLVQRERNHTRVRGGKRQDLTPRWGLGSRDAAFRRRDDGAGARRRLRCAPFAEERPLFAHRPLLVCTVIALLTACGGGGVTTSPPPPPPPAPVFDVVFDGADAEWRARPLPRRAGGRRAGAHRRRLRRHAAERARRRPRARLRHRPDRDRTVAADADRRLRAPGHRAVTGRRGRARASVVARRHAPGVHLAARRRRRRRVRRDARQPPARGRRAT